MGSLLHAQGKHDDAEPLYREALEGRRRTLGDEHHDTLDSLAWLGWLSLTEGDLLQRPGKLTQAEPLLRKALEARRRVLGEEHHDTPGRGASRYAASERTFGSEHPRTHATARVLEALLAERPGETAATED
ncbi:MAG TPA: tetratricopeptide repeat protein, partial [Planctomycetes bacterium]|nr:tetratricopeptide repeat protein [Planctomycetota bacterium]